jgi:hypothetical protein
LLLLPRGTLDYLEDVDAVAPHHITISLSMCASSTLIQRSRCRSLM